MQYGIRGATILYTILMAILSVVFAGITVYFIRKRAKSLASESAPESQEA